MSFVVPFLSNRLFSFHRVGRTCLTLWTVLQGGRSGFDPSQRLHRIASHRGRQNSNHFHRSANSHHSRQRQRRNVRCLPPNPILNPPVAPLVFFLLFRVHELLTKTV